MNILQVITSLRMGGAEKLIADMVPLYREHGYEADVLLFDGSDTPLKKELEEKGIRVFQVGRSTKVYNPLIILKLVPYLRQYDIVHTHNTSCLYFVALAKLISGSLVRLVTTEHSTTNRRRETRWFRLVDRWMYGCYNAIITISGKATDMLSSYLAKAGKIYTVYNGIHLSVFFNAGPFAKNEIMAGEFFLVSMVAGFREEKDQDTLIRAMALLPDNYSLCLVGDGVRRPVCEELVKKLGLERRVVFLGVRNDVPRLLKTSDVVVMSSHWEGFGLAAVEGMAAGKPVVASDVPGLAQVVDGAGILFPVEDARALAFHIEHLMNDQSWYQQIAGLCLQRASEYDIRKTVDAYEKIYEDLYKGRIEKRRGQG